MTATSVPCCNTSALPRGRMAGRSLIGTPSPAPRGYRMKMGPWCCSAVQSMSTSSSSSFGAINMQLGTQRPYAEAGAAWHRGGDVHEFVVHIAEAHHRFAEHVLIIGRCARLLRGRFARRDVERAAAVKGLRIIDGDLVAFALLGEDVQEDR